VKNIKLAVCGLSLILSSQVHAGFVKTDWLSDGDNLALLHEETGIEWLSLGVTDYMSINQVKGLLDTTFAGWRLPTYNEVNYAIGTFWGLDFEALNNQTFYPSSAAGESLAMSFESVFGQTARYSGSTFSFGLYESDTEENVALMSGSRYTHVSGYNTIVYDDNPSGTHDGFHEYYGVYLVSDGGTTLSSLNDPSLNINNPNAPINNPVSEVSEPAAATLIGLGLLSLFIRRKTKKTVG